MPAYYCACCIFFQFLIDQRKNLKHFFDLFVLKDCKEDYLFSGEKETNEFDVRQEDI